MANVLVAFCLLPLTVENMFHAHIFQFTLTASGQVQQRVCSEITALSYDLKILKSHPW